MAQAQGAGHLLGAVGQQQGGRAGSRMTAPVAVMARADGVAREHRLVTEGQAQLRQQSGQIIHGKALAARGIKSLAH
jgi:hypothetical protein